MKHLKGPFFLFCAFSLAGTSVIAARIVSGKLGTFTITAVSLFFALLFLLPLCGKRLFETLRVLSLKRFCALALQSLFGMFLFRWFLITGVAGTSAGEAGILTGVTPALTAVLAGTLLKEPFGFKRIAGISSTIIGVLLIQGLLMPGSRLSAAHFAGNLLVLCAASCESLFNILSRFFARSSMSDESYVIHPAVQSTVVSAVGMILCLIPAMFENPLECLAAIGTKEWFTLIWYGIFVTALAFICWYAGIMRCGAVTAAAFSGMMPLTSLLLSVLLLNEAAGLRQWAGGSLVISGIVLLGHAEKKQTVSQ